MNDPGNPYGHVIVGKELSPVCPACAWMEGWNARRAKVADEINQRESDAREGNPQAGGEYWSGDWWKGYLVALDDVRADLRRAEPHDEWNAWVAAPIVHRAPSFGRKYTPCCHSDPAVLPPGHRCTSKPFDVTCTGEPEQTWAPEGYDGPLLGAAGDTGRPDATDPSPK